MFTNALFKWAAIGLLVVCIGLGITVWIQKGIIKEQGETIGIQKTEIARLNGELEKKEKDIERLNSLADKNAQNLKEAQIRMGQILAMSIGTFTFSMLSIFFIIKNSVFLFLYEYISYMAVL